MAYHIVSGIEKGVGGMQQRELYSSSKMRKDVHPHTRIPMKTYLPHRGWVFAHVDVRPYPHGIIYNIPKMVVLTFPYPR